MISFENVLKKRDKLPQILLSDLTILVIFNQGYRQFVKGIYFLKK